MFLDMAEIFECMYKEGKYFEGNHTYYRLMTTFFTGSSSYLISHLVVLSPLRAFELFVHFWKGQNLFLKMPQ